MVPTPSDLLNLPETPSQTAGPYVHIGLIPHQAGFDIFQKNFSNDLAPSGVQGQRITIEGRVFDGRQMPRAVTTTRQMRKTSRSTRIFAVGPAPEPIFRPVFTRSARSSREA
jgi:hypothetical protein